MVQRVKAYLLNMRIITDEEKLIEMSNQLEPSGKQLLSSHQLMSLYRESVCVFMSSLRTQMHSSHQVTYLYRGSAFLSSSRTHPTGQLFVIHVMCMNV